MQDRFKFRVWDKINKIWVKNFSIDEQGFVEGFYNPQQAMNRRLALIQCTGLKDKNGKLIYEGDIVTPVYSNASLLEPPFTGQVVSGKACFEIKSPHIAYNALQILNSEKAFEIIGNIYENSELLESEVTNE